MKFNFKKIASTIASAVMLSSTIGIAAAASWPAPFVSTNGVADAAVVYPSAEAANPSDAAGAVTIQNALGAFIVESDDTTYTGEGFMLEGTRDILEVGEKLYDVEQTLDNTHLDILGSGTITNEKGTATYDQEFQFDPSASPYITYRANDDDEPAQYLYIPDGAHILNYTISFSTVWESDISTATATDQVLGDIQDKTISILGQDYTVTSALNGTNVALQLMSGSEKTTLANGEVITIDGQQVSVLVSSSTQAKFIVDGEESDKLNSGDSYKFTNGAYLGVTDVTYQNYAGGLAEATFYLGGHKLELTNGQTVTVDGDTIDGTTVTISSTETNADISIDEISIKILVSQGDDVHVPIGGKLSDYLDEPAALFGQNWDIVFEGMADVEYEDIKLSPASDNEDYSLTFSTEFSEDISLPLIFVNATGTYGGKATGKELILDPSAATGVKRNQYFILNDRDPAAATNNAQSCIVRYVGTSLNSNDPDEIKFEVVGTNAAETPSATTSTPTSFSVKLCGKKYNFANASSAASSNYDIKLTDTANGYVANGADGGTMLFRTMYNTLLNITDGNISLATGAGQTADWTIEATIDDGNRDDENVDYSSSKDLIFGAAINNSGTSNELVTVVNKASNTWVSNPSNDDESLYITDYGVEITQTALTSTEERIELRVPASVANPQLKVVEGEVQVSSGSTGNAVLYVTDAQVSSVASKNIIVVGGSCINTVAANLLGSAGTPLCTTAFTTATTVDVGEYLIEVFDNPYDEGDKIAMLVAGYEATDTTRAAKAVAEGITEDIIVGTKVVSDVVG